MDPVASAVLASWSLDWGTLSLLLAAAVLYFRGWWKLHAELAHKYTAGKLASFLAGLAAIAVALESPVDAFGALLLQAHMIQHLLLIVVAPLLLLLAQPVMPLMRGLPRWAFKDAMGPFLASRELKSVGRVVVHPVFTWLIFAGAVGFWHLPRFYELALASPEWHEVEHACFFWSALLFWWPVIGVWPGKRIWPEWAMVPYLLAAGLINMGLSAALSFSDHVIYPSYAAAPRLWGISALDDQSAAGGIMWVPGSIAMLIPAVILGVRALQPVRIKRPSEPVPKRTLSKQTVTKPGWGFSELLRYRHSRRIVQGAMLALAIAVAVHGFTGPQVAAMNLAGILPWTYWRGLAVIALLLAGNLFCMACPFTLPRDLARKFVATRFQWPGYRWPAWLRSKWLAAALLATYLWAYEAFSLWDRPSATAWIIVGYFAAAFTVDMLFKGASFCKYVCPIGQFHFVNSMISPMQVSVREPAVCNSCTTYDCIRGNATQRGCELQLFQPKKTGNFDCTFCMDCVTACPTGNVGILHAKPVEGVLDRRLGRRPDVAALALILVFGAFVNAAGMTEPVMMWMHRWHARLGSMLPVVTLMYLGGVLVLPAVLAVICAWISQLFRKASLREVISGFSLALVPLGFSMWLAHFSNHLFRMPSWMPSVELASLDAGLLVTLYALWRVAGRMSARAAVTPWATLAAGLYSVGVLIVLQPMQMRGM